MREVVHQMRNHLAVAVANIEAFVDGVLAPTPARLEAILHSLTELDTLIGTLPDVKLDRLERPELAADPREASAQPPDSETLPR